jgi:hypothetical protein
MKSGVNRLQGRNSNYMDFNPDGSTILSSGNTSIQINTDNLPTAPVVTPSTPSNIIVPNLSKTTGSFETIVDIIPLTSPINPLDIRPTASLNIEDIFATVGDNDISLIPDEEELFTLYGEIDIVSTEIEKIIENNSTTYSSDIIKGIGVNITTIAQLEINKWKGKKENDPTALPLLEKYAKRTPGPTALQYANDEKPWSSTYVSYIMSEVDNNFKKDPAHKTYIDSASRKERGYGAFSLNSNKNIQLQVGDILTYPRPKGNHGDIIYKIVGDTIYLTGGNLSGTVVSFIRIIPSAILKPGEKIKNYDGSYYTTIIKKIS